MAGGSSSLAVSPRGLPVFRTSASTSSSVRASTASANRSSASCRSLGVVSRHFSNAAAAARIVRSTSASPDTGAGGEDLAGRRVDEIGVPAVGGLGGGAIDEVVQHGLGAHRASRGDSLPRGPSLHRIRSEQEGRATVSVGTLNSSTVGSCP
jgi:hypothetical protein